MRKKLFTLFLAVAASVGTIFAEEVQIGDLYYNIDATNQTAEVTSQNGGKYSGDIVIPSSVTYKSITYSVTSIGVGAFYLCTGLTSVTIPNSVTSIGSNAFGGCIELTSPIYNAHVFAYMPTSYSGAYTIPDGIESIAGGAFQECTGLTSITIPNSVTSIGMYAFSRSSGLTSPVYNAHVFAYLPTSYSGAYTIPDGIESIAGGAFDGCSGLTSITIPNSVTSIGDYAFVLCTSLTSVTIPNSVTSIGYAAFYGCSGLTSPVYNAHVFAFMPESYSGAYTIPDGIESIAGGAFYSCTGLTSVTIPNSVTSIGELAFYGCSGLTSITCEAMTPPTCGSGAFDNVSKSIPLYVPFGSEDAYQNATGWKDFTKIQPIADNVDITTTEVVPDETSVNIAWPKISGAYTYELVIKDKSGKVVCTLVFDAEGRLLSIAFNAPARDNMPQQTQVAGFAFTVTGLKSGTTYNYSIVAKNSNGNTLNTESGSFKTTGESTGLQNVTDQLYETKFFRNGQLFILRDGNTYSITGQEVK